MLSFVFYKFLDKSLLGPKRMKCNTWPLKSYETQNFGLPGAPAARHHCGETDGRTPDHYIILCLPLDAVSVIIQRY